ncbi:MAG: hypothetical protein RLZZ165_2335 [Bacteroidota bacterium]|jgi:hypothetical protein
MKDCKCSTIPNAFIQDSLNFDLRTEFFRTACRDSKPLQAPLPAVARKFVDHLDDSLFLVAANF